MNINMKEVENLGVVDIFVGNMHKGELSINTQLKLVYEADCGTLDTISEFTKQLINKLKEEKEALEQLEFFFDIDLDPSEIIIDINDVCVGITSDITREQIVEAYRAGVKAREEEIRREFEEAGCI